MPLLSKASPVKALYSRMPHYQAYYWQGLGQAGSLQVVRGPWWYRLPMSAMTALDCDAVVEQGRQRLTGRGLWHSPDLADFVGRYTWKHGGKKIKFAIDAHDLKTIVAPEILDWCDVYFKANKWAVEEYPAKVVPVVNGNGFLRNRHLNLLGGQADQAKRYDIIFISRVWGGIEHNTRVFEALAALPVKKKLVAIFVEGANVSKEVDSARKRLEKAGVTCTTELFSARYLWQEMAASKVVVFRAGKHLCIPWRMIDLLCMGACVVTDADFFPVWPSPLTPGKHYISCGIRRPQDTSFAESCEYEKIGATITDIVDDDDRQSTIRHHCRSYFANHAAPARVGEYIFSKLRAL